MVTSKRKKSRKVTKKATKKNVTKKKATKRKPAKKVAKKTTAKKAVKKVAKKRTTKKSPKKALKTTTRAKPKKRVKPKVTTNTKPRHRVYNLTKVVPEGHFFVLCNGQPVKHVAELASVLDQIEDHVFHHHVTPDKNDFHNWIKDIFEDLELARKISGVSDKKRMQLVIYRHLAGHD